MINDENNPLQDDLENKNAVADGEVTETAEQNGNELTQLGEFADDLDAEYGEDIVAQNALADEEQLAQDTEGFAGCFPKDWDLHPPRK